MQGAFNSEMSAANMLQILIAVLTDCHLPQDLQQLTLLGFIFQGTQITKASIAGLQLDIQVLTIHCSILLDPRSDILDNIWVISHSCQSVNLLQTEPQCKSTKQHYMQLPVLSSNLAMAH